jgi:hypothetical protein
MTVKKKLRTIQPPHPSDKFTLEEAMDAWRRVEGKAGRPRTPQSSVPDAVETPAVSSPDGAKPG